MFSLSLFGTVSGLEVRTFGPLSGVVMDEWIALNAGELRLASGSSAIVVSRRAVEAGTLTWIGLYRPAAEMTSDRGGGCMGAGVWLLNKSAPATLVLRLLGHLADQVGSLATSGGRFVRRLSSIESSVEWHDDIGREISQSLEDLPPGGGVSAGDLPKAFLDASGTASAWLPWFVDAAQTGAGVAAYRALLIGTDAAVVDSATRLGRLTMLVPEDVQRAQAAQASQLRRELGESHQEAQRALGAWRSEESLRHDAERRLHELERDHGEMGGALRMLEGERDRWRRDTEQVRADLASAQQRWKDAEHELNARGAQLQTKADDLHRREARLHQREDEQAARAKKLDAQRGEQEAQQLRLHIEQATYRDTARRLRELEAMAARHDEHRIDHQRREDRLQEELRAARGREQKLEDRLRQIERDAQLRAVVHTQSVARQPAPPHGPPSGAPQPLYIDEGSSAKRPRRRWGTWLTSLGVGVVAAWIVAWGLWSLDRPTDAAVEPDVACSAEWSGPQPRPFVTVQMAQREPGTASSLARALWGLACMPKRPSACFTADVRRMSDAVIVELQHAKADDHHLVTLNVDLPRGCAGEVRGAWAVGNVDLARLRTNGREASDTPAQTAAVDAATSSNEAVAPVKSGGPAASPAGGKATATRKTRTGH